MGKSKDRITPVSNLYERILWGRGDKFIIILDHDNKFLFQVPAAFISQMKTLLLALG
jgi:hypothetical protein